MNGQTFSQILASEEKATTITTTTSRRLECGDQLSRSQNYSKTSAACVVSSLAK